VQNLTRGEGKNHPAPNEVLINEVLINEVSTTATAQAEIFNLKDSEINYSDPDAGLKTAKKMSEYFLGEGRDQWISMGGKTVGEFPNVEPEPQAVESVTWDWANSERNITLLPYWRRHVGKVKNWISTYNNNKQHETNKPTNAARNGRVQQQRTNQALLTPDELKQRYGLV
jgi:hypothetical protein